MPAHPLLAAHLKLADMVSYVPLPVVGGYLGFVGYFCIAGGTALAAGVQVGCGHVATQPGEATVGLAAISAVAGTLTTSVVPMRPACCRHSSPPWQRCLCRFAMTGTPTASCVQSRVPGLSHRDAAQKHTLPLFSTGTGALPQLGPPHPCTCEPRRSPPLPPRPKIDTLSSWLRLASLDALTKLLPTAATIAATMLTVEHCRHPLALPALIAAVPLAFHGVLWAAGWSLADAQATGWVMPPTVGAVCLGGRGSPQGLRRAGSCRPR